MLMTQRPPQLSWPYLNPNSPLYQGLVFAGLGPHPGGFDYHDCSPYGNTGTLTNMDPPSDWLWVPQLGRWGMFTDAVDGYVACPTSGAPTDFPFTVSAWVRPGWASTNETFVSLNIGSTRYFGLEAASSGALSILARNTTTRRDTGTTTFSAGSVIHTAGVFAASDNRVLYVNGVSEANGTGEAVFAAPVGYLIGTVRLLDYVNKYSGMICDVLIHNRILSLPEIQQLADPSNTMLSGLIPPPQRKWWPVVSAPAAFKPAWAANTNQLIGGGVG